MLPRSWLTHAASLCIGAGAAAAGVLIQLSRTSNDSSDNSADCRSRIVASDHGDEKVGEAALVTLAAAASGNTFTSMQKHMLPTLPVRLFQPNDKLVIAFDTRNKNPLFSMERLTYQSSSPQEKDRDNHDEAARATSVAVSRKNKRFYEESTLLPYHRSRNHHYRNSGYDRGHLAPAADFSSNDKEMNDTFVLSNISPQLPRFNRSIWLRFEEFVRRVAKDEGSETPSSSSSTTETWVITGPLWLPTSVTHTNSSGGDNNNIFQYSYAGIGNPPSLVSVPTHFFKVLVVVDYNIPDNNNNKQPSSQSAKKSGNVLALLVSSRNNNNTNNTHQVALKKFAAFVLPNSNSIEGNNNSNGVRLIDFAVRLTDLEAVSGLEFFPALFGTSFGTNNGPNPNYNGVIPLQKEVADALTDDLHLYAENMGNKNNKNIEQRTTNSSNTGSVLMVLPSSSSNGEELSKGRRRKIKQLLRDNTPIPFSFQHLCRNNEACFKILKV